MDLPSSLNRKAKVDLSVKTTGNANAVCMSDCLRVYDAVSSGAPLHMTVIIYSQDDSKGTKKIESITEVNLTDSLNLLFGSLTREEIEKLDQAVKKVPLKRRPTPEEYKNMYDIRNSIQDKSGAMHLDIKCDSKQSRLQCSFNRFQKFLEENKGRIIERGTGGNFRGGAITEEIVSKRRVLKKRVKTPTPDSAPHSPPI